MLKVVYFASIREQVGVESESLAADAIHTVQDLVQLLIDRGEPWAKALQSSSLLVAVNQEMTGLDALVSDGDEVAFFPPVTGG